MGKKACKAPVEFTSHFMVLNAEDEPSDSPPLKSDEEIPELEEFVNEGREQADFQPACPARQDSSENEKRKPSPLPAGPLFKKKKLWQKIEGVWGKKKQKVRGKTDTH